MNGNPLAAAVTLQNVGGTQAASLTLNTLPVGNDPVLATYQGDSNFSSSQSSNGTPLPITVNQDATLTTLNTGSWPSTPAYGGQITLSATVCGLAPSAVAATASLANCSNSLPIRPTGSVRFFDGSSFLAQTGNIDGNGNASVTIQMQSPPFQNSGGGAVPGNHTITALYQGDGNFAAVERIGVLEECVHGVLDLALVRAGAGDLVLGRAAPEHLVRHVLQRLQHLPAPASAGGEQGGAAAPVIFRHQQRSFLLAFLLE
jgi:hypothetical protein